MQLSYEWKKRASNSSFAISGHRALVWFFLVDCNVVSWWAGKKVLRSVETAAGFSKKSLAVVQFGQISQKRNAILEASLPSILT